MPTSQEYLRSVIPDPVCVFGVRLKPFSIGHCLILHRFDSPLLSGKDADITDVFFGIYVCSHTYRDCLSAIETGRVWDEMREWKWQQRKRSWFGLRPMSPVQMRLRCQWFAQYVADAMRVPSLFTNDEGGAEIGSPPLQVLRVTLMRQLHVSESAVMDYPLALAWYDYATCIELEGKGKIIDEAEYLEAQAKADEFEAKYIKDRRQ